MNNSLISKIMGSRPVNESDVVPVPGGALPAKTFRDRNAKMRRKVSELLPDSLAGVLGEAQGDVIPDDAKELDRKDLPGHVTTRLNTIKDVVEEPGRPRDPDEIFITPKAALTAPDATPDNMTPMDPSDIPGVQKTSFTGAEAEMPQETPPEAAPEPATAPGQDTATRTMDLLLGRRRTSGPAKRPEEFAAAGAVATAESKITEDQASAMLGLGKSGQEILGQSVPMPEHKANDAKAVYDAARRWV